MIQLFRYFLKDIFVLIRNLIEDILCSSTVKRHKEAEARLELAIQKLDEEIRRQDGQYVPDIDAIKKYISAWDWVILEKKEPDPMQWHWWKCYSKSDDYVPNNCIVVMGANHYTHLKMGHYTNKDEEAKHTVMRKDLYNGVLGTIQPALKDVEARRKR